MHDDEDKNGDVAAGVKRTTTKRELQNAKTDGLEPLAPLDPTKTADADELLTAMSHTAMGGRNLGEAADLLHEMTTDPECFVVMTLSGAMTVAKMGLVICRMIEYGMVNCIISTGALMAHGLTEGIGLAHYKPPRGATDKELFAAGYNRVYDTIEMEQNLNDVERVVHRALEALGDDEELFSERLCQEIGRDLSDSDAGPGVLRAAYEHGVPVYIPAFTDSEIGLDVATWALGRARKRGVADVDLWQHLPRFNPFCDLMSYARLMGDKERLGIFTIGGGVPRNWAQQVAPFYDLLSYRLGLDVRPPRFRYGLRICPEPVHWGGLSGCTYSEGVSWGKFVPESEGGRFSEVLSDATLVWPLLVRGVIERMQKGGETGGHVSQTRRPGS